MVERNRVVLDLATIPENIGLARLVVAVLAAQADFTLAEVDEVKLAVSEAVTNAIVHGFGSEPGHVVRLEASLEGRQLEVVVSDQGRGIENVEMALQPAVSSDPDRMGLGFSFMDAHMDSLRVESEPGRGTRVLMTKKAGSPHLVRASAT